MTKTANTVTHNNNDNISIVGSVQYHELVCKLAQVYKIEKYKLCVAIICDEILDTSGRLLGDVRTEYRKDIF